MDSMRNKKIWYYKMKIGFWQDEKIVNMENVPMYGDKFIVTLLKLYDYSLQNKGLIKVENYASEANYATQLAKICRVDVETMELALSYYIQHGLLEVSYGEDNSSVVCHLPYVQNNTGSISEDALRKREYRARIAEMEKKDGKLLTTSSSEVNEDKKVYGVFSNISLSENLYYRLKGMYENIDSVLNRASIEKDNSEYMNSTDEELLKEYIIKYGKQRK